MKIIIKATFFLFLAFSTGSVQAQDKKASAKSLIDSRRFVFKVQTISPTSGISRQSNSEYDLKISGDTLISYLPYFGRAYSAPMPGENGGYNFTSIEFEYNIKNRKKGGWEILIRPKDVRDFREFSLTISEKGYGTLRALSNNRQPISYTGYVSVIK